MSNLTLTAVAVVPDYFVIPLAMDKGWIPMLDSSEEEQYTSAKEFITADIKKIIEDYPYDLQREMRTKSLNSQIKDLEDQLLLEEDNARISIESKVQVIIEEE